MVGATSRITILILGVAMYQLRDSLSLITITVPAACRAKSSHG
jgi:hypothetical protein